MGRFRGWRQRRRQRLWHTGSVFFILGVLLFLAFVISWHSSGRGQGEGEGEGEPRSRIKPGAQLTPNRPFPFPKIPLDAQAAILMDAASGRVLYSKNGQAVRPPASLTKLMTALVAYERARPGGRVSISSRALQQGGARAGVCAGREYRLQDLLQAMLFLSGNDAAVAVAEHVAGSVEAFAELMNARARELGARHTHFCNPNGLHDPEHYSTAYDLALIARAVLAEPYLAEVVGSREAVIDWAGTRRSLRNINKFLRLYPGATGLKTGYTDEAGFCLAASAQREGHQLIAIILGASTSEARWADAMRLLDTGFANYAYLLTGVGKPQVPRRYHTVRAGETLAGIARRYGLTEQVLREANNLATERLDQGQILSIP